MPSGNSGANAGAEPDDADLVRGTLEGHLACFDRLVHRHEGRLVRFLLQRTGNRQDAEDIAQTAFVAAYRNLRRFDPARRFAPWLFTIAVRQAVDHYRKHRDPPLAPSPTPGPGPPGVDGELAARLWGLARNTLSRSAYETLWLYYVESMSVKEIARVQGRGAVHVRVLLHRGRLALGQALTRCAEPWVRDLPFGPRNSA